MLITMVPKSYYQTNGSFCKYILVFISDKPDEKKADDGKKVGEEVSSFNGKY